MRDKPLPTVGATELNLEKIVSLKPDLILGINSYIDETGYRDLSSIAPTVAEPAGVLPGATTSEEQTRITGKALGREDRAQELVAQTRQLFDDAIREHPEFAGKSARFLLGLSRTGDLRISPGVDDYRSRWLTELGFQVPARSEQISFELIDRLEADVLVAEGVDPDSFASPLVQQMPAVREGRFLNMGGFDQDFAGAWGFNSPPSIPFLLETAVPRLAAALDGDPATTPEPFGN
ncbi:ABC transporter substrate-binding protein [Nocardia puris]|uniref:Substrate-binding family protein n=1 Tax=Nocardia puris TaxID=208602 RepID=A0A366DYU3_9NOCA|nr:ABC transporter substrate-binding protein [Nocardia puris]RBO94434.1 substrate-binding family protein [Nocardia puris]